MTTNMLRAVSVSAGVLGVAVFLTSAYAADDAKISLTIYNNNLALVQEQRPLDLKQGRNKLEFKDVSASIRPETVSLVAPDIGIVEQNFDFDLLTPEKLMEKAVGNQVKIVRINPGNGAQETETATVLSVNNGVVLKIGDRIEVLRADNVPTRVIFDKVPDNLRARPTLSVTVDAEKAGHQNATLSYLTTGLSWKADYVALFDENAKKLDLQGWITLTNNSGTTFNDAQTQLIAGDVQTIQGNSQLSDWERRQLRSVRSPGNERSDRPQFADYYAYPLKDLTSVANKQTKQVSFIDVTGVTANKIYQYEADWFESVEQIQHAEVGIRFANSNAGGLATQLPAGITRIYVRDIDGTPKFVGENRIGHTPRGSEILVKIGEAFDVTLQQTLVKKEKVNNSRSRYVMEYLIKNARGNAVTVEVIQGGMWRNGKVLDESIKSLRVNSSTLRWQVPVAANGETKLSFSVENGW
jgi:hypothetical protein